MDVTTDAKPRLHAFILRSFLAGEDPEELTETTPLMTSGILDSIGTLKLVSFIEGEFHINIDAHEAVVENLNTIRDIAALVAAKKSA